VGGSFGGDNVGASERNIKGLMAGRKERDAKDHFIAKGWNGLKRESTRTYSRGKYLFNGRILAIAEACHLVGAIGKNTGKRFRKGEAYK